MGLKVHQDGFKLANALEWQCGSLHEIEINVNLMI